MKNIILNSTISNYILLILKIILSLMLVRIMFLGISNEEYGFWALLWSVFGYSLLLDFGFGTAVQKATSESQAKNNWKSFNETISTIFFSYIFLSFIILIVTVLLAQNLEKIFVFSSADTIEYYKTTFYIFGIGSALLFPFGFFKEVLRGLQKITLRNNIDIVFLILNFVLLSLCISYGYSLIYMAAIAIVIQFLTNVFMAIYVFKNIPSLKISFSFFKKKRVYELMSFSIFAYIVMFSNVIIFRTDQLVISMFSTVALVGVYQIVSRVSELFRQFSTQIHDILGPLSASLFVTNKHDALQNTLLHTNKIVGFISTLLFIPTFLYIDKLLYFWLEIESIEVVYTAMILLVSMYVLVFFRSSSVQVLLMCERHKELTVVAILEAIMNLVLSIYLVQKYSIIGVALGTLIPNIFFAIIYNIPVSCKFSKISVFYYLKEVVFKTIILGCIVYGVFYIFTSSSINSILDLLIYGLLCVSCFTILYYIFMNEIDKKEIKKLLINKIKTI
ncbi:oligosaccharide flippase family protein [Poseidonibacter lekithochrous]|uniref:oligosaccharide flippase family protein n=1 Tax=Poseidonibacter lekithochrous TaxID=1904463 RepID=UPI000D379C03|nr:oligosaccharide flippase family protein [Poseidonibacter lekithochrous]